MAYRSNRGQLVLVAVTTMLLTALIGGATLFSVVNSRTPVSGAMDRLIENTATNEDMDALQNVNENFERTSRILRAGGSFIGAGGPLANPAGGGDAPIKTVVGLVHRTAQSMASQAANAPPTKDTTILDTAYELLDQGPLPSGTPAEMLSTESDTEVPPDYTISEDADSVLGATVLTPANADPLPQYHFPRTPVPLYYPQVPPLRFVPPSPYHFGPFHRPPYSPTRPPTHTHPRGPAIP